MSGFSAEWLKLREPYDLRARNTEVLSAVLDLLRQQPSVAIADLACGAQAHFQISAVTGHAGPAAITVFGSQGTLQFVDGALFGGRRDEPGLAKLTIPDEERGAWREEAEFIGAIRGQEQIALTPFETGVKYMIFTEAVTHSIATGAAIPLL